jgi:hypothetical protein
MTKCRFQCTCCKESQRSRGGYASDRRPEDVDGHDRLIARTELEHLVPVMTQEEAAAFVARMDNRQILRFLRDMEKI